MTYQDYITNKFSSKDIKETDFYRANAYAEQSITALINNLIPIWKQQNSDTVKAAITDATVQQIEYLNKNGMQSIDGGRVRKRESLEGYSIEWETTTVQVNGMQVVNTAVLCLENAFRLEGLMFRGLCK